MTVKVRCQIARKQLYRKGVGGPAGCLCGGGGQLHLGLLWTMVSRSGGVIGACETASGVLCPVWSSPGEDKEQLIGASPVEAHQDGQGLVMYEGKLRELGLFSLKMR